MHVPIKTKKAIVQAFRRFKKQSRIRPTLAEEYYFKACCADLISRLGFVPAPFITQAAELISVNDRDAEPFTNLMVEQRQREDQSFH